jgi:RNA polymerase sigma-70 factor, ECF subfamily
VKKAVLNWQVFFQCRGSQESRGKMFNSIWSQYQKRLMFFIGNMIKDRSEDLFQEVMLKVYENLDKYNPIYSFNTWIYSIARNHCLNYLSKRVLPSSNGFEKAEDDPSDTDMVVTPQEHALYKELHQTIHGVLSEMNEDNRQIAFLRFFEGMKEGDIARIVKMPKGTVKSRLHYIRVILKDALEKYHER